jgi:hypothetical protein
MVRSWGGMNEKGMLTNFHRPAAKTQAESETDNCMRKQVDAQRKDAPPLFL